MGELRVVPAAELPFDEVAAVFGERGVPYRCWCQWFRMPNREFSRTPVDTLREEFRTQVRTEPGAGLVALDGDEPVGWVAVAPRPETWRLRRAKVPSEGTTEPDFDDAAIWAITCFVVPPRHRRSGVAAALAARATEWAFERGARLVEAYPVDTAERTKPTSADLYTGTRSMFEASGYEVVGRPKPDRPVMQRRRPPR